MERKPRRIILVLLVAALALAIAGQFYFTRRRDYMWDGVALYALAALCFALVLRQVEGRVPRTSSQPFWARLHLDLWELLGASPYRLAALIAGVALSAWVAKAALSRTGATGPYYDLLVLWLVGIVLACLAFVDLNALRKLSPRRWTIGPEAVLVTIIILATFLLRAVRIGTVPHILSGDEAAMGLEALAVLEGLPKNPFTTGWLSHPTLYFFIQAGAMRLFGANVAGFRLPSAFISAATALLIYAWAKYAFGRWVALLSILFFATYHYAVHFGRIGLNNIWDPFFAIGALYGLTVGLKEKRIGHLVLGGLLTGLAIYFYMGARLIPFILLVYVLHAAISERAFLREHLAHLVVFGVMALVAMAPLLLYFASEPANLMARWRWLSVTASGWTSAQAQQTGRSELAILFDQFVTSALAFHHSLDPTFHYRPGRPLLLFVPAIFFVFGLVYALRHWRRKEYFILFAWILLVMIFGSTLLENPPSSPRLVLSIPAVVLCVAIGIWQFSKMVRHLLQPAPLAASSRRPSPTTAYLLSLVLVGVSSLTSAGFYFGEYTTQRLYSDQNTLLADRLGRYLAMLGPEYQCYFFGPPRIYFGHATIPFFARDTVGVDVREPLQGSLTMVNTERNAVFAFVPERQAELEMVRRSYPDGLLREFRDHKGHILFIAYEVLIR